MHILTWDDLAPHAVPYATAATGRVTQGVWQVARSCPHDSTSAQRWLCDNTPRSLLGLGFIDPKAVVHAVMLTTPTRLALGFDCIRTLPAGTEVRALFSNADVTPNTTPQLVLFDLPDSALGPRAAPPYCARIHNGRALVPPVANPKALMTPTGQMELLLATRALATAAGADAHVRDIDRRLQAMLAHQNGPRALAC